MHYLGVDTGGTFTDFVALNARTGAIATFKLPSVPEDPARAVLAGVERLRDRHGVDPSRIGRFIFGTTVATNAVLERKGAKTALVATRGGARATSSRSSAFGAAASSTSTSRSRRRWCLGAGASRWKSASAPGARS